MPSPREVILGAAAKVTVGMAPYVGEIQWQKAGAPGREDFEPLQHIGNVGVPAASVIMTGMLINEPISIWSARKALEEADHLEGAERANLYVDALNHVQRRIFIPVTLGVAALAGVYSETIDSGTHDPVDAAYTVGAAGVALFIYDRIRQWEFKNMRRDIKVAFATEPTTQEVSKPNPRSTETNVRHKPEANSIKASTTQRHRPHDERAHKRKAQKASRKRNRK